MHYIWIDVVDPFEICSFACSLPLVRNRLLQLRWLTSAVPRIPLMCPFFTVHLLHLQMADIAVVTATCDDMTA
jgi:hypothetical protein